MTDSLTIERTVTADEVRRALLALVTTEGDRRNPSVLVLDVDDRGKVIEYEETPFTLGAGCVYTTPSGEHCLAAKALASILGEHLVPQWDTAYNQSSVREVIEEYYTPIGIRFDEGAQALLSVAQSEADGGDTWFDAIATADEIER